MEDQIVLLLQPITDELGVDILSVSLGSSPGNRLLRVIVDKAGGVDADTLARISRGLSLQLDAEDMIGGRYRLEVTSPGLDWPLQSAADFSRHQGEWVKVCFQDGTSQEGRNLGPVENEQELCFGLQTEGKKGAETTERQIALREVHKVVRAINWKEVSRGGK